MKGTSILLLSLALACLSPTLSQAQEDRAAFPIKAKVLATPKILATADSPNEEGKLIVPEGKTNLKVKPSVRKVTQHRISNISDVLGGYVLSYTTYSSKSNSGGQSVNITSLAGDSVVIHDFFLTGAEVHAKVDVATGVLTIPAQPIGKYGYYTCDLISASEIGQVQRDKEITGSIDGNGNITINGYWGLFPNTGSTTTKDRFQCLYGETEIEKANGSMAVTYVADDKGTTQDPETWNVVLAQPQQNVVTVKNFGNHGATVEVELGTDHSVTIKQQLVWNSTAAQGDFYTAAADWSKGQSTTSSIFGTGTESQLSWGQWVMASSKGYFTGRLGSAIVKGITFTYPTAVTSTLSGSGTETDPYQVKTLDDLRLIAQTVNSDTRYTESVNGVMCTQTYKGKYFRLENDIDLSSYRFEPIGNYYTQRFAGTFDGNGHKLTGLNVNTGSNGFAGLFGVADSVSVIKNLTLEKADVKGAYYYAAGIASASYGLIDNCHVSGTISNTGLCAGGIVGYGMNVSNCTFSGTINAAGGVGGGIAAQANGLVTNCHAQAGIYATVSYAGNCGAGGIVGTLYGPKSKLTKSYFTGLVSAQRKDIPMYLGGAVGEVIAGTVDGVFAAATVNGDHPVSTSPGRTGGVVGGMLGGNLLNSYSTGNISQAGSTTCGGVTGYISGTRIGIDTIETVVRNCYFAGQLKAETYLYDTENGWRELFGSIAEGAKPTISNVYYDSQMISFGSKHGKAVTADLVSAEGPKGFSSNDWVFAKGYYPRVKGTENSPEAQLSATVLQFDSGLPDNVNRVATDFPVNSLGSTEVLFLHDYESDHATISTKGNTASMKGNTFTLNGEFGNDTIAIVNTNADGSMNGAIEPRIIALKVAPKAFDGYGSEEKPYLIQNKADLMKLGEITTSKRQFYPGIYFLQTADIDMQNDTTFLGICDGYEDLTDKFAGHYDGGGHTIHNMVLNTVTWKEKPTADDIGNVGSRDNDIYKGFVGSLAAEGSIKNLTIAADCHLEFAGFGGAFVGYNYGTVENCRNYADVTTYRSTTGGIVGSSVDGSLIKDCYNSGRIRVGRELAGGIVGDSHGDVVNCQNVGTVSAEVLSRFNNRTTNLQRVGGIAGRAIGGSIVNVVNAGVVFAQADAVGGIIGMANDDNATTFTGAVNYGTVFCGTASKSGAVEGKGSNPGPKKYIYFDKQLVGLKACAGDADPNEAGMTTAELTNGKALEGLSTDVFSFKAGQYPILKLFENEPLAQTAAKVIVNFPSNETSRKFRSKATLSTADSVTWKLAGGTSFTIKGSELDAPSAVSSLVSDTLIASTGNYTKPVLLTAITALSLNGDGTEANPYQLATVADWDTLVNYVANNFDDLEGNYVKVMNDIDFTGNSVNSLGATGTVFAGHLLGDGHSFKGIDVSDTKGKFGVIGTLGTGGSVSFLTMEGTVTTTRTYGAGFTGVLNGTLTDCVNKINVTGTGDDAGFAYKAGRYAALTRCTNNGTISAGTGGYCAGFVAETDMTGLTFTDCVNEGGVISTGSRSYAAGFVAYSKGGVKYVRCVNRGDISMEKGTVVAGLQGYVDDDTLNIVDSHNEGTVSAGDCAGGISGQLDDVATLYARGCYNTGDVMTSLSKGSAHATAGLFAYQTGSAVIDSCYNTGNVYSTKSSYTGGIVGAGEDAPEEAPAIISNCYNIGEIIGSNYAGGIVGQLPAYTTVTDCYNKANVTADIFAAGLIGSFGEKKGELLQRSWNSGDVLATTRVAGGLANAWSLDAGTVTDCFNVGTVTSNGDYAGGLAGQGHIVFTRCYNRGAVKGVNNVGGLQGEPGLFSASSVLPASSFTDCYNAAKVEGTSKVGNIIGNGVNWNSATGSSATGTRYVTDWASFGEADSIGTPTTVKELSALQGDDSDWLYGNSLTLPVLKLFADSAVAKAYASAAVLTGNDTYDNVTNSVKLGTLSSDVIWSSSNDSVNVINNSIAEANGSCETILYATCGSYKAPWPMTFSKATTGINRISNSGKTVKGVTYYNAAGQQSPSPFKGLNLRVTIFNDGTSVTEKILK